MIDPMDIRQFNSATEAHRTLVDEGATDLTPFLVKERGGYTTAVYVPQSFLAFTPEECERRFQEFASKHEPRARHTEPTTHRRSWTTCALVAAFPPGSGAVSKLLGMDLDRSTVRNSVYKPGEL